MEIPCVATDLPDCWVVGNGMLGGALADTLRLLGYRVLTLDNAVSAEVQGDAADCSVLLRAQRLLKPRVVFCCQATSGGDVVAYQHTYVAVVDALHAVVPHARVVFCSSASVYGDAAGVVNEQTPPLAPAERARMLLEAESRVLLRQGVVLRLSPLYGKKRCEVLRRFLAGEPCLPGAAERWLNYLYEDDAVAALMTGMVLPPACYNVSGESCRKSDLYAVLAEVTGVPVPSACGSVSKRGLSDRRLDCSRLMRDGWAPVMTLRRFAEQFSHCFLPDAS